jgi:outer membrane lipoprotein SlyB
MKAVVGPLLALASLVAGCVTEPHSASVYPYYETQNEQSVRMATVESVRNVRIVNPDSGTGALSGTALGGLAGSTAGSGTGQAAAVIAGALAGGLIGQRVESHANTRPAFEITVKLENGELRAITQEADEMFKPGERVRLVSNGYRTRVTH